MSAQEKVSKAVTVLGVKILDIYMNNHANLIIIIKVFLKASIFNYYNQGIFGSIYI